LALERGRRIEFEGEINDVKLDVVFLNVGTNHFFFTARGERANLAGTVNPVTVGLTIGNDQGSTMVKADIDH
jgi:hypothetical protein